MPAAGVYRKFSTTILIMEIQIQNTQPRDIDTIFQLYEDAIDYQKKVGNNHWLGFERTKVEKEIREKTHYKILAGEKIVGTFCITLSDPVIWKDPDETTAVYIHRIATSPSFRGNNLLSHIIHWARAFAQSNTLSYIRMDTGEGNDRLINYYIHNGFTFVRSTTIIFTPELPAHYSGGSFALLQMSVW
jgi:ribosomal protein S18 acetylase RimI-like enzyme